MNEVSHSQVESQAEHQLLETLVQHMPAAVCLIRGSDLRLKIVNRAYQALAPGKPMVGKTLDEVWAETGRNFSAICFDVLDTGKSHVAVDELFHVRRTPSGSLEQAYFSWSLHRVPLPSGQGWGLLNTAWETTRRKYAEERERALIERSRTATAKFEAVFNQSGIFAGIVDLEGNLREVNDRAVKWCGYTRGEVLNRPFWETPWWRASSQVREQIRLGTEQAASGKVFREVLQCWLADGTERIVDFSIHPIRDKSGAVRFLHPTGIDITQQKRAEADLQFQMFALDEAAIVAITDISGSITYVNDKFCDISGYSRKELIGQNDRLINSGLHPVEFFRDMYRQISRGGVWRGEIRNQRKDGSFYWVDTTIVPELGPSGKPQRYVAIGNDITERKRTEEALRKAKEQAEVANAAKDQFIAALSHELRTPLMPVLLTASEQEYSPKLSPDVRADFAMIRQNIQLEARLIDDLLDVARIAQGKLRFEQSDCNLHWIIRQAAEMVRPEIDLKGLFLELRCNAKESTVIGDRVRLQQVIWNLLCNAAKFTPHGGSITIETRNEAGQLRIEVADTGSGITPQDINRIFRPFEQARPGVIPEYSGGLGLGLSISNGIVTAHGGKIWAESAGENRGSIFHISLPLASITHTAPTGSHTNVPSTASAKPLRVLVVEDHEPSRSVLVRLLTRAGHDVSEAESVAGAREHAASRRFDLVISDIGLPDGDGHALMRELHQHHGLRGIAISGYGMDSDIQRSTEAGFVTHLVKPITLERLRNAIAEADR